MHEVHRREVFAGDFSEASAKRRIFPRALKERSGFRCVGDFAGFIQRAFHRAVKADIRSACEPERLAEEILQQCVASAAAKRRTHKKIPAAGVGSGLQTGNRKIAGREDCDLTACADVDKKRVLPVVHCAEERCLIVSDGSIDRNLERAGSEICVFGYLRQKVGRKSGFFCRVFVKAAVLQIKQAEACRVRAVQKGRGPACKTHGNKIRDRAEAGCRFGNKTVVDIIIVCRQPVARRRRIAGDGRQVRSPAFGFVEGQSCPFVLPRVERAQTPAVSVEIYDAVHLTRDADGANLGMFTHKLLYEGQRRSIDFLRVLRPLPTLTG